MPGAINYVLNPKDYLNVISIFYLSRLIFMACTRKFQKYINISIANTVNHIVKIITKCLKINSLKITLPMIQKAPGYHKSWLIFSFDLIVNKTINFLQALEKFTSQSLIVE